MKVNSCVQFEIFFFSFFCFFKIQLADQNSKTEKNWTELRELVQNEDHKIVAQLLEILESLFRLINCVFLSSILCSQFCLLKNMDILKKLNQKLQRF